MAFTTVPVYRVYVSLGVDNSCVAVCMRLLISSVVMVYTSLRMHSRVTRGDISLGAKLCYSFDHLQDVVPGCLMFSS